MAQIVSMLVHAYMDAMAKEFADAPTNDEKPTIIKEGRLQDDPTKFVFSIMVNPNDYEDDGWADTSLSVSDNALLPSQFKGYAYEVGGGEVWWRRGIIEWQIFGIKPKYDQDSILVKAAQTKGRIEHVVQTLDLKGLTDEFGESAKLSLPVWSNMFRSGGEQTKALIWRGKIRWMVLTTREAGT